MSDGPRAVRGRAARSTVAIALVSGAVALISTGLLTRPRALPPAPTGEDSTLISRGAAPAGSLQPAPDLDIILYQGGSAVGGDRIRLSQLWRQGRPVVVNFWAGLCPPCRAEMPDFEKLYTAGAQGRFFLVGVDVGRFIGLGSQEEGKALLRELGVTFPAGTTLDARPVNAYRILGMPTTVFITAEGKILRKHVGLLTPDQMRAFLTELLGGSGAVRR
jgi:thiol-disulfide isomerase/thioredoxin